MSKNYKNSPLSVTGRKAMVDSVLVDKKTHVSLAKQFNVSVTTVNECVKRYREEGESGLENRPYRLHTGLRETPPKQWNRSSLSGKKER